MSNSAKSAYRLAPALAILFCAAGASPALANSEVASYVLRQSWQVETIYLPGPCIDEHDIEQAEQDEDDLPACPPR